jgi:uncharacterized lipoprotein YddW (UPF0748 family)
MNIVRGLFAIIIAWCLPCDMVRGEGVPSHPPSSFEGKRAILDGGIPSWTKKEHVDEVLSRIKRAGFNVYMPTVWQGRGTAWPSKHAPWDTKLEDRPKSNFDPLRYAIEKAHEMGIEVHPWFTLTLRQSDIFPEFALSSMPQKAFDVHNPEFRELLVKLIEEVTVGYDIDGINLDYVRAIELCTSMKCEDEYSRTYKRSLNGDTMLFRMIPNRIPSLIDYQETAVTTLVRGISEAVRAKKPHLLLSADVFVGHAPLNQGQNSVSWVNDGLVDVIFRMDYGRQLNIAAMDRTRQELNYPDKQNLLISNMSNPAEMASGQAYFARDGKWLADTITDIQKRWPKTGIAVYFYKYLTDEQIAALQNVWPRIKQPIPRAMH